MFIPSCERRRRRRGKGPRMANTEVSARRLAVGALGLGLLAMAVCATTPSGAAAAAPAVRASLSASVWGDLTADLGALNLLGQNDPAHDPGSLYTIENAIGARSVWRQQDARGRQITG